MKQRQNETERYSKVDLKSQREKNSTPWCCASRQERLAIRRGSQIFTAKNQQTQKRM
jgi:hypothetical protein